MTGLAVLGALAAVMLKRQHQALGWAAAAFAGAAVLLSSRAALGYAPVLLIAGRGGRCAAGAGAVRPASGRTAGADP